MVAKEYDKADADIIGFEDFGDIKQNYSSH